MLYGLSWITVNLFFLKLTKFFLLEEDKKDWKWIRNERIKIILKSIFLLVSIYASTEIIWGSMIDYQI